MLGARRLHSVEMPPLQLAREVLQEGGAARELAFEAGADFRGRQADRIARAEDRTHRGAGDRHGLDAELVERLQDDDVREPARRAAAQRQRNARAGAAERVGGGRLVHAGRLRVRRLRPVRRFLRGAWLPWASAAGSISAVWLVSTRSSWRLSWSLARPAAVSTCSKR